MISEKRPVLAKACIGSYAYRMLSKESFGDTSEAVIRRSPDNEIVKKKKDKGKTIIYKTLHRKLKIEEQKPQ
jgi:hypothetical protein